jgi:hypothetical protein
MPIAWRLADPKIGERDMCLDLVTIARETGRRRAASTILADKGLAGHEIEHLIANLEVQPLRPDRRDERARHGNLGGVRQWIDSVFDSLKGQLGLEQHGGRTVFGLGLARATIGAGGPVHRHARRIDDLLAVSQQQGHQQRGLTAAQVDRPDHLTGQSTDVGNRVSSAGSSLTTR